MNVTHDILYVGVNDHAVDLFEGQYTVPHGMSYNSYLILDDKVAVMDTVDRHFTDQWLTRLDAELGGRQPDYLIVQHVEPDHSAGITAFFRRYPEATLVTNAKALTMITAFFGPHGAAHQLLVADGDTLSLGRRTLTFLLAPMVHWPEVMVSYASPDGILFSADGFGKFGALDQDEPWEDEARRYYIGIVGKYGQQVQALLKKASALTIRMICPLHGPVLSEGLAHYLSLYDVWSSYRPQTEGICLAYTSVYGNTAAAAQYLADRLTATGQTVVVHDLARCDMATAVADAFRYSQLVLACPTYNADLFPYMRTYLDHLVERGFRNRRVALIENGSWAPMANKLMRARLEKCRDLTYTEVTVTLRSALSDDSRAALDAMAAELCS